jgi:hypothetical protein
MMSGMKKHAISPSLPLAAAVLVVAALLSLLPLAPARAAHPHERDGWLIGMSYGYGRGRFTEAVSESSGDYEFRGGATPQIRFGHMVGKHVALHLEYGAWMFEDGVIPLKARVSMQDLVLAATWYPGNPETAWGGFFVRAGAGLGWASVALIELNEELEQTHGDRLDESGLGVQFSLGYEWRFTREVALGLGVGVQHLDIGGDFYDETTFVPTFFSLNWYWD